MSEPNFTQEEPRSLLIPAILALLVLGAAFLTAKHFYKVGKVEVTHLHTAILPTTTVMRSNTIVVGANEVDHTTFVATTLKIESKFDQPVFLDDFTLTITDQSGATLSAKSLRKQEFIDAQTMFPQLGPLAGTRLNRDTAVDPGKSVEGTLIFSFSVPQSIWDDRKSADLQVDIYHSKPVTVNIPK